MNLRKHGILVTGTHRSGTTWMGRMLSLPRNVVYIHEPFNLETSSNSINYRFEHWFPHTPDIADRASLYREMRRTMSFHHVPKPPAYLNRYRALRRTVRMHLENLDHRFHGHTPLLKDPLALLSAEDLAFRFHLDVVCMIRHPLAFCSSLKKWDWKFPFSHFVEQPRLMKGFFQSDRERIEAYAQEEQPIVHQATLLWNLFHKVIRKYQKNHPDWHFPRHEDMVADPVSRFRNLYQKLDLDFTDAVESQLRNSLSAKSGETTKTGYDSRDAATVTQTWKDRLTPEEIEHILEETTDLRHHFYPEDDASRLSGERKPQAALASR